MGKLFTVIKGKVKYPTWCPQGLTLKEVGGNREYPVDRFLGDLLIRKVGKTVEENIDFEVIQRRMGQGFSDERTALLCDKGEVAGGGRKRNNWYITLIEEDENGKQKEYLSEDLTPIQHAQRVETPRYLDDVKWRNIQNDFIKETGSIRNKKKIVEWFRKKLSDK